MISLLNLQNELIKTLSDRLENEEDFSIEDFLNLVHHDVQNHSIDDFSENEDFIFNHSEGNIICMKIELSCIILYLKVDESSILEYEENESYMVEVNTISSPDEDCGQRTAAEMESVGYDSVSSSTGINNGHALENGSKLKSILLSSPKKPTPPPCLTLSPLLDLFPVTPNEPNLSSSQMNLKVKKKLSFALTNNVILKLHYRFNHFPSAKEILVLAKRLRVSKDQVSIWFQKQRNREKLGNNQSNLGMPLNVIS